MIYNSTIDFPNIGIHIENLRKSFSLFGIDIAFYGVAIALGMVAGFLMAEWQAKRTGQDPDLYLDFALYAIVISVIGARIYYVIFSWNEFKDNPLEIFNSRGGGLAIYGGIIAAVLTAIVYAKLKKVSFWIIADTGCVGLVTGQIIGRWGNFFNQEAFGKYSDGLLAMRINWTDARNHVSEKAFAELSSHVQDGMIQVHPTFLYESMWNFILLIILIVYTKHKKFDGELILMYLAGYGIGRAWIEGLRTDQLFFWGTKIAVSQVLSIGIAVIAVAAIIYKKIKLNKNKD